MILNEILNTVLPWKWVDQTEDGDSGYVEATFHTATTPYTVTFTAYDEKDPPSAPNSRTYWSIEFMVDGLDYPKSTSVTGSGSAPMVFATVKAIIHDFMQRHPGDAFGFTGAGESRQKLYDKLVKRYSPTKTTRARGGEDTTKYRIET